MLPSIYEIETPTKGALYIMPKPSGEWLSDDLSHYALKGIQHIVSMLEPDEQAELGLSKESELADGLGMKFTSFPIPDRNIPDTAEIKPLAEVLAQEVREGINIAIHCRAGIGRSGLLACCVLKTVGLSSDDAIELVSEARGLKIPDTDAQVDFIQHYSADTVEL